MRRWFMPAILVVTVIAALVLGPGPVRTGAQGNTPSVGASVVGAWRLTVTSAGRPATQSLATFSSDGTLINSDQPISPAGDGQPATISSVGHGVWHQAGATTVQLTFVELVTDLQGRFLGTTTVSAQLTLGADGQNFRGPFTVTVADPSGKVLFTGTGAVQATRIAIQPMATPTAGSPAA